MSQYVVWEHCDPRLNGDNFSEVSKTVSFIGSFNKAHKHYREMRAMMKFAGTTCHYLGFPMKLKGNEQLKVGDKVVIYPDKTEPDDDDYHNQYEEGH